MSVLLIALLAACGTSTPAPALKRVDAAQAPPPDPQAVEGFCDTHPPATEAKAFSWPALAGEAPPATSGWRWVNVWATWCGPCVEEMPMITAWKDRLAKDGVAVDLQLLSFDEHAEDVDRFVQRHPGFTPGPRIAGKDAIAPWFTSLGLSADTAIPLHVFVDPDGRARCLRAGAISEDDYTTVKRVLRGE
jgi:thiol-disulfide isomerase/thioredoxin